MKKKILIGIIILLLPKKEVEKNEDFSIFTYQLCIERDFISEILSNGTDIEVLEPQSLRDNISTTIRNMLGKYGGWNNSVSSYKFEVLARIELASKEPESLILSIEL